MQEPQVFRGDTSNKCYDCCSIFWWWASFLFLMIVTTGAGLFISALVTSGKTFLEVLNYAYNTIYTRGYYFLYGDSDFSKVMKSYNNNGPTIRAFAKTQNKSSRLKGTKRLLHDYTKGGTFANAPFNIAGSSCN